MRMMKLGMIGAGALAMATGSAQAAIDIQFDYSYDTNGFFTDSSRRATLEAAANAFESRFLDTLDAIVPGTVYNEGTGSEFSDTWTAKFSNPATGTQVQLTDLTINENVLVVYAGGRDLSSTGALGIGGPGGYSSFGIASFGTTVATRGEAGAAADPATDFGPWGGAITFDTGTDWHFGLDTDGLTGSTFDFLSVALHELAHVLGVGTSDSWNTWSNGTLFTGPNAVDVYGESVLLDDGLGHWAAGTMSLIDGVSSESALDPDITPGTRKLMTDLDWAGMADIGWEVTPIPEPASLALLALGGAAMLGRSRRAA